MPQARHSSSHALIGGQQNGRHGPHGALEAQREGERIERLHSYLLRIGHLSLVERLGTVDVVEQAGGGRGRGRIQGVRRGGHVRP